MTVARGKSRDAAGEAAEIEPHSLQATYLLGLAFAGASAWQEAHESLGLELARAGHYLEH
jgi:hypothetical protein